MLLENPKVDPNLAEEAGCTPLFIASWKGHYEVVRLLLANPKVDPNVEDTEGSTPLLIASEMGHANVVKFLLQHPNVDDEEAVLEILLHIVSVMNHASVADVVNNHIQEGKL
eukprot:TRINITY_DN6271_c0_g1_i1.p2 TRINITY_DN6271_c0_g1~~TRINITY_DN6271_c0_g1_i1.p2  ORF type:complete len:112 (+),score=37.66 TRINITY_DN6271_c0_g1_i1:669-1004(+)